jgi:hypothetical protein
MGKHGYRLAAFAFIAATAMALTGCKCFCPHHGKVKTGLSRTGPVPILLGEEPTLEQIGPMLLSEANHLQEEAVTLRREVAVLREKPFSADVQQRLGMKMDLLSTRQEALALKQAALGSEQQVMVLMLSTNESPGPFTGGSGQNTCCPSYCGYINFNNSGYGFSVPAGSTFTIQLSQSSSMSPLIDTSQYCARWRYGGGTNQSGCFTTISSTQMQFTAPATALYTVTVYLKSNCPPTGTVYYLGYSVVTSM